MRLRDRVVLITGGATGIGAAAARACGREGARVLIGDLNEADGEETVARVVRDGGQARFARADVTDEDDARRLAAEAEAAWGRLDALITSAGVLRGSMVPVEDLEAETWDGVMDVNLKGTFLCVKHAVPALKRSGRGVILCVSSGAGVRAGSSSFAYGASKGGVHGFGLTLMDRLAPDGIRVHVICPGNLDTPLKRGQIAEAARTVGRSPEEALASQRPGLGDPEGVGKILAFLASDEADYVRGTIFTR
jgi:NAD(P)-dependent dehydrogenase (short-subunit alcohol dehydrogenase family)